MAVVDEVFYRPVPGEWNGRDAMPDDEEVLFALDDLLDIVRREGKGSTCAVATLARFDLLRYRLMADWSRRLSAASLKAVTADFLARFDAIVAKHRILGPLVPRHKHVEVFPWVACAVCGAHPDGCNPLPLGWCWDTTEPSDNWAWCPEHRI